MTCEKCGFDDWRSIYWIKGKRHCGECAATVFSLQLQKLRKRFSKVNAKLKTAQKPCVVD